MKTNVTILCASLLCVSCSNSANPNGEKTNNGRVNSPSIAIGDWKPDTQKLDDAVGSSPNSLSLDNNVKNFYELLHKKDWKATYDLRWKAFKKDIPEEMYIKSGQVAGATWKLLNYEVLSVSVYNDDDAMLICRFVELPGPTVSYSVINWRKEEDGIWRCDAAGPERLTILQYLRYDKKPDE